MSSTPTYRFYLSILGNTYGCNPLGKIAFKTERESGQVFYRTKLSGTATFSGNDFKLLISLENSSDRCQPVGFIVERLSGFENGHPLYNTFWKGKFSTTDAKWCLDKCQLEVSIPIDDAYSKLFEEYEREHNVLQVEEKYTVKARFDFEKTFEFATSDYTKTGETGRESDYYALFLSHFYKEPNIIGINREFKKYVYFREIAYTLKSNVDEQGEPIKPAGSGWGESIEDDGTRIKWARLPQIANFKPFELRGLGIGFQPVIDFPEIAFFPCDVPVPSGWLEASPCSYWEYIGDRKLIWQFGSFYFNRNRKLIDVLSFLVEQTDTTLLQDGKIVSTLLTDEINPVTLQANPLKDIMVSQKSDIKGYYGTEPAKKGMTTLKAMLEDLKAFNWYYFINETGKLQIEHLSFFKQQGSIDTKPYPQNKSKRTYTYQQAKMPRYEKLTFAEPASEGFASSTIEYVGSCVNRKEGENTASFSVSKIATDVESIILSPDDYSNEGFVLMTVTSPIVQNDVTTYDLLNEYSALQFREVPNYHLSAHRIMENYYQHGRVMRSGFINNIPAEFQSVQKNKKQEALSIHYCTSGGAFNPMNYFITELSEEGELLSAEHTIKDDMIKIEILHEALFNMPPFETGAEYSEDYNLDYTS